MRNKRVYLQLAVLVEEHMGDGIAPELWKSGMVELVASHHMPVYASCVQLETAGRSLMFKQIRSQSIKMG